MQLRKLTLVDCFFSIQLSCPQEMWYAVHSYCTNRHILHHITQLLALYRALHVA